MRDSEINKLLIMLAQGRFRADLEAPYRISLDNALRT